MGTKSVSKTLIKPFLESTQFTTNLPKKMLYMQVSSIGNWLKFILTSSATLGATVKIDAFKVIKKQTHKKDFK